MASIKYMTQFNKVIQVFGVWDGDKFHADSGAIFDSDDKKIYLIGSKNHWSVREHIGKWSLGKADYFKNKYRPYKIPMGEIVIMREG